MVRNKRSNLFFLTKLGLLQVSVLYLRLLGCLTIALQNLQHKLISVRILVHPNPMFFMYIQSWKNTHTEEYSQTRVKYIHTRAHTEEYSQTRVKYIHTRAHTEEYSTDYIRIFVMFLFCMYFLIYKFNFVCTALFWMFFSLRHSYRVLHLPFQIYTNINGGEQNTKTITCHPPTAFQSIQIQCFSCTSKVGKTSIKSFFVIVKKLRI